MKPLKNYVIYKPPMTEVEGSIFTDFTMVHIIYDDIIAWRCVIKIAVTSCAFPAIWIWTLQCELASSESLSSSPVFAMIVGAAARKGRSQFTEDDFVPEKKCPRPEETTEATFSPKQSCYIQGRRSRVGWVGHGPPNSQARYVVLYYYYFFTCHSIATSSGHSIELALVLVIGS